MEYKYVGYRDALNFNLIRDGDILLFRSKGIFAYLIQTFSSSLYSHAAIVSTVYNQKGKIESIECLEFLIFVGSRATSLENYVKKMPGLIDVFRVDPIHNITYFEEHTQTFITEQRVFDPECIVETFRGVTGLEYSLWRVICLSLRHLSILKPFLRNHFDDSLKELPTSAVCSTMVAHVFNKCYTDLVKFKSDEITEPSDIASSPILNYLFTLK